MNNQFDDSSVIIVLNGVIDAGQQNGIPGHICRRNGEELAAQLDRRGLRSNHFVFPVNNFRSES